MNRAREAKQPPVFLQPVLGKAVIRSPYRYRQKLAPQACFINRRRRQQQRPDQLTGKVRPEDQVLQFPAVGLPEIIRVKAGLACHGQHPATRRRNDQGNPSGSPGAFPVGAKLLLDLFLQVQINGQDNIRCRPAARFKVIKIHLRYISTPKHPRLQNRLVQGLNPGQPRIVTNKAEQVGSGLVGRVKALFHRLAVDPIQIQCCYISRLLLIEIIRNFNDRLYIL